jgi:hypothetical protein
MPMMPAWKNGFTRMNISENSSETTLARSGLIDCRTNCGTWNSVITRTGTNRMGLRWRAPGVRRRADRTAISNGNSGY